MKRVKTLTDGVRLIKVLRVGIPVSVPSHTPLVSRFLETKEISSVEFIDHICWV